MTADQLRLRLDSIRRKIERCVQWMASHPSDYRYDDVFATWRGLHAEAICVEAELDAIESEAVAA